MSAPPRVRWRRRGLLWLTGALVWTLLSSYPNPAVLLRSLGRYRKLPVDPGVEKRMRWELPESPAAIEAFVDSLLVPMPDWQLHRVPWYVPTAAEAARARYGDCEAKAILLASLLAGRHIPFEVRASLHHIWVDYPGRRERAGESREIAYLEGKEGQLALRWPRQVEWAEFLAVQRDQLWAAMPLARKALWLTGLVWFGLGALALWTPQLQGLVASDWRIRPGPYLARAGWLSAAVLSVIAVAPSLWRGRPPRWSWYDVWEGVALALLAGAFLAWTTALRPRRAAVASPDGRELSVTSAFGPSTRTRRLAAEQITCLQLGASPGGLRPWTLSAALQTNQRVPLAHMRDEAQARAGLRRLGLALHRPVVVQTDRAESRTEPEEIPLSLGERAARRPPAAQLPGPRGSDLIVDEADGRWVMRYPAVGRGWVVLLAMAAFPAALVGVLTWAVMARPWVIAFWAGWVVAGSFLCLSIYLAVILRGEIVARLAEARVEIADGELTFHTPERRVEKVGLDQIQAVEFGRIGETPTLVIVSPDRVIHLRDICPYEHRAWARQELEQSIIRMGKAP